MKYPLYLKWRIALPFIVAFILLMLYQVEESLYLDLHSAQVCHDYKTFGIPIWWKIEDTELSKVLREAGIVPDKPPRWEKDGYFGREYFTSYYTKRRADWLLLPLHRMDEEYQETGDEKYFLPEDARKRYLLFALRRLKFEEGPIPSCFEEKALVEFMNRFREEANGAPAQAEN